MEKIKNIKNKTPHEVVIIHEDGSVIMTIPSDGSIRLSQSTAKVGVIGDIPITKTSFGGAELPPQEEDAIYIVSSLVCQAYPDRSDFYIPDGSVRDKDGRIIGCKSLSQNPFGSKSSYMIIYEDSCISGTICATKEEAKSVIRGSTDYTIVEVKR